MEVNVIKRTEHPIHSHTSSTLLIGHDAQLQQVPAPSPKLSGPYRCPRKVWLQVEIGLGSKGSCMQGSNKPHAYVRLEEGNVSGSRSNRLAIEVN
jgi:hypothetical protein